MKLWFVIFRIHIWFLVDMKKLITVRQFLRWKAFKNISYNFFKSMTIMFPLNILFSACSCISKQIFWSKLKSLPFKEIQCTELKWKEKRNIIFNHAIFPISRRYYPGLFTIQWNVIMIYFYKTNLVSVKTLLKVCYLYYQFERKSRLG